MKLSLFGGMLFLIVIIGTFNIAGVSVIWLLNHFAGAGISYWLVMVVITTLSLLAFLAWLFMVLPHIKEMRETDKRLEERRNEADKRWEELRQKDRDFIEERKRAFSKLTGRGRDL